MIKTINYYNENAKNFVESTFNCDMSSIYEMFTKYLKDNSKIIDLGFGSGRDSIYLKKLGHVVLSVDPTEEFVNRGKELGLNVLKGTIFDVSKNNYYDAVFACASLLHVEENNLANTFREITNKLKNDGILYCSFKYGVHKGERNGRYFIDLNEETINNYLPSNLNVVETKITEDVRDNNTTKWLNLVIKKN